MCVCVCVYVSKYRWIFTCISKYQYKYLYMIFSLFLSLSLSLSLFLFLSLFLSLYLILSLLLSLLLSPKIDKYTGWAQKLSLVSVAIADIQCTQCSLLCNRWYFNLPKSIICINVIIRTRREIWSSRVEKCCFLFSPGTHETHSIKKPKFSENSETNP